jgi:hypothetical protein
MMDSVYITTGILPRFAYHFDATYFGTFSSPTNFESLCLMYSCDHLVCHSCTFPKQHVLWCEPHSTLLAQEVGFSINSYSYFASERSVPPCIADCLLQLPKTEIRLLPLHFTLQPVTCVHTTLQVD